MKKYALVTGATGDIGGAFARELVARGYHVYAPVRSLSKPEAQELMRFPDVTVSLCDVEDTKQTSQYIQSLAHERNPISVFVLAAGTFKWDKVFSSVTEAIDQLISANMLTKENVLSALDTFFTDTQKQMSGIVIGSHAAHFAIGDPMRVGEEGYVASMKEVFQKTTNLQKQGRFKQLILEEPGLIDTAMARKEFTKETIGHDPDWEHIVKPSEYVKEVLNVAGL